MLNDNLAGLGPTVRLGRFGLTARFAGQRSMTNARRFLNKYAAARRETKMAALQSPVILISRRGELGWGRISLASSANGEGSHGRDIQ